MPMKTWKSNWLRQMNKSKLHLLRDESNSSSSLQCRHTTYIQHTTSLIPTYQCGGHKGWTCRAWDMISCFHRELSIASLQNFYFYVIVGFSLNWVCQDCNQIVVFWEKEKFFLNWVC
jgi:hypothetical protein